MNFFNTSKKGTKSKTRPGRLNYINNLYIQTIKSEFIKKNFIKGKKV